VGSYSFDVAADNFQQVVIEGSRQAPVIVDFWAPWCGPCRSLKPIMEKLAEEYQGKFILAKVNSDENQELATQYGVRGIPNVKAFIDGAMADEFSGALPESQVREFIDNLIPSPADDLRAQAGELFRSGNAADALQLLAQASQLDPQNEWVRVDAAEIMLSLNETDEVKRLIDSLSSAVKADERVTRLLAKLQFAGSAHDGQQEAELQQRIAANPADLDARLQLANLLIAGQQYAAGLDQLLEIVQRDRGFNDDIGRKTILSVFTLLSGEGNIVAEYRRKLASALNV
jgi:putative thioredoxin